MRLYRYGSRDKRKYKYIHTFGTYVRLCALISATTIGMRVMAPMRMKKTPKIPQETQYCEEDEDLGHTYYVVKRPPFPNTYDYTHQNLWGN